MIIKIPDETFFTILIGVDDSGWWGRVVNNKSEQQADINPMDVLRLINKSGFVSGLKIDKKKVKLKIR